VHCSPNCSPIFSFAVHDQLVRRNAYDRQYHGPVLTRPFRHLRRWRRDTRTTEIIATIAVLSVAVAVLAAAAVLL
jgi:hypothetical protein